LGLLPASAFRASFNTYIDGLRERNGMNEETFGIESVEVMKGPSSTLYGRASLRHRQRAQQAASARHICRVQFTGGSYGFYESAIDAGIR